MDVDAGERSVRVRVRVRVRVSVSVSVSVSVRVRVKVGVKTCWSEVRAANREPRSGDTTSRCHSLTKRTPPSVARMKSRPVLKVPLA